VGIYIDYAFRCECSEEELLDRLRRLRRKLEELPFRSVSKLLRVDKDSTKQAPAPVRCYAEF
jgi:hypothetical protein